ncbi:MAG: hypothetical protein ABJA67_04190, partial [Chthonomonadales bacterium]
MRIRIPTATAILFVLTVFGVTPKARAEAANPLLKVRLVQAFSGRTAVAVTAEKPIKVQVGEKSGRKIGATKEIVVKAVGDRVKVIWTDPDEDPTEAASVTFLPTTADDPLAFRKPSANEEPSPPSTRT